MGSTGRPRVFVSSTVFDFRDLRSALRFWLTELGYDAQLSDFNDFAKPLDTDSYNACLKTIEDADYFVLLIGSRVGGWFNETEKISITRQEYRHAYECFRKHGKPQIVTFVRGDVWNVHDDRADLERMLLKGANMQREVSPDAANKIAKQPSRFVNDAEAIFSFIDEVKRKDEMLAAMGKGSGFPTGNWVHTFNSFSEIIDVMRVQARAGSVRRAAIVSNLCAEIVSNADAMVMRSSGVQPFAEMLAEPSAKFIAMLPSEEPGLMFDEATKLKVQIGPLAQRQLGFFVTTGKVATRLRTHALEDAIRSGEFLRWDSEVHALVSTPLHKGLVRLRDEIALLRANEAALERPVCREWQMLLYRDVNEPSFELGFHDFMPLMGIHHRHENILALLAALLEALEVGSDTTLTRMRLWTRSNVVRAKENIHAGLGGRTTLAVWLHKRAQSLLKQAEAADAYDAAAAKSTNASTTQQAPAADEVPPQK